MSNELAVIAIKGGRYLEAEKMFNKDLKKEPTHESYFGLGICKLNLLLDVERNVDEVVYCFEKSLQLVDSDKKGGIKDEVINLLVNTLNQFKDLYNQLEEQKKKQATNALIGGAITIGAAMIGSSNNSNAFTQIASLAAAGAGVGISLDGLDKLGQIPEIQEYIVKTANEIISKTRSVLGENYNDFEDKLFELSLNNFNGLKQTKSIKSGSSNELWFMNNTTLILAWLFFWPIGLYGSIKRNKYKKSLTQL
jgi:hypothetical protein